MHPLPVVAIATNISTSIGLSTADVWASVANGHTGITNYTDEALSATPFWASRLSKEQWALIQADVLYKDLSPFEQMSVYSAQSALAQCKDQIDPARTLFILSTTKGNIEWLGQYPDDRIALSSSARMIAAALQLPNTPVVISHACVSGVVALLYALRQMQAGKYDHAIVTGADRFSQFVLNGFQSFQAIADAPCRPFDAARNGINLGEAAATIILSTKANAPLARLFSGATSNDANHISGPSRTGAELAMAASRALQEAGIAPEQIDMISAHGTATLYNDEMEAKAFAHAGLLHSALHSMKGYVGHTLGAAGILESAMVIESMQRQQLIPSIGYNQSGVSEPLNVTTRLQAADINYVLKTASGFGGCNAVAVWGKG